MANLEMERSWQRLYNRAQKSGLAAGAEFLPHRMIVTDGEKEWTVDDGPCGFAWVKVRPGNGSFGRWLRKTGNGRTDSYAGGVIVWVNEHGQSIGKKLAHAEAMATVFNEVGIKALALSRMD